MTDATLYQHVMDRLDEGLRLIPPHMRDGVRLYVDRGLPHIQLGHFLTAILSNDFMGAVGRADDENIASLKQWAQLLYSYFPPQAYGSPERVKEWQRSGGARGIYNAEPEPEDAA